VSSGLGAGSDDGPSTLEASMSTVAELLKGWIDTVAANRVHCGSYSALVAIVSHFPKLKTELEVLGLGCSADLTVDKADALWIRVRTALDSLASHVPSSIARNSPDDAGE
jgi:hypothetical protein